MRRSDRGFGGIASALLLPIAAGVLLTGCGTVSGVLKSDGAEAPLTASLQPPPATVTDAAPASPVVERAPAPVASPDVTPMAVTADVTQVAAASTESTLPADVRIAELDASATLLTAMPTDDRPIDTRLDDEAEADAGSALAQSTDALDEDYDPWEPFNEKMFSFNRNLDRYVLKPAARAYRFIMPEPWQVLIANGFDNINFVPRMVNSLLQAKWGGAGRELSRFLINSTAGIGGLFDPAKDYWGIQKSREDFGQTLCVWGAGTGPYLILPLMEPLTVRDGIGRGVDSFMDPLSYVLPFFWDRLGMKMGDTLNDRALNYDLFQGFEESVIDMYSAVRHGYLQRRRTLCKE